MTTKLCVVKSVLMVGTSFAPFLCIGAASIYSLRSSLVKDLGQTPLTPCQINFFTRLVSFFPILFLFILLKPPLAAIFNPTTLLLILVVLVVSVLLTLIEVDIYQKNTFSNVTSFGFLSVFQTTILASLVLNQHINPLQFSGMAILGIAFVFLLVTTKALTKNLTSIILFYSIVSLTNLTNSLINQRLDPLVVVGLVTVGNIFVQGLFGSLQTDHFFTIPKESQKPLFFSGLLVAISFLLVSYCYRVLPAGVISALLTFGTFFSLLLSSLKYQETNLRPKAIASSVAMLGIIIMAV